MDKTVGEALGFEVIRDNGTYIVFRVTDDTITVVGMSGKDYVIPSVKHSDGLKLGREFEDAVENYLSAKERLNKTFLERV